MFADIAISHTAALLLTATAWGSMLFFAAAMAPSVFIFLEPATAGRFIRRFFPVYYLALLAVCALTTLALAAGLPNHRLEFGLMLAVSAGFALARQWLMPTINRLRDKSLAGDAAAEVQFQRWHRASVVLNMVQMLIVLAVLYRLAT